MELKFRDLRADEVELRVGATTEKGFTLLLYKTARVDANLLDEVVGCFNWQKRFYQVKNTMICSVGIRDKDTGEWCWKDDAGDESNTEAIKGEASDSFKRAGFAWGIGRKLYNSPFVWINKDENNDPKKTHYFVKEIEFDNNGVSKLIVCNEKSGEVAYSYPKGAKVSTNAQNNPKTTVGSGKGTIRPSEKDKLNKFIATLDADRLDKFINWLNANYHTTNINDLSDEQGIMVATKWKLL